MFDNVRLLVHELFGTTPDSFDFLAVFANLYRSPCRPRVSGIAFDAWAVVVNWPVLVLEGRPFGCPVVNNVNEAFLGIALVGFGASCI